MSDSNLGWKGAVMPGSAAAHSGSVSQASFTSQNLPRAAPGQRRTDLELFKAASLKINPLKHSPWGSCSCWDFKGRIWKFGPTFRVKKPGADTMGNAMGREDPMAGTGRRCSQTHTAIFKGELSYETHYYLVLQSGTGSVNVLLAGQAGRLYWLLFLKWRDSGCRKPGWKGLLGEKRSSKSRHEYPGWKIKHSLNLRFSWLLYFHYKLWKLDQRRFLLLPGWHTHTWSHQWLMVYYRNSLIILCCPPLWKRTWISCHTTMQCCQLTPCTRTTQLVHTSLISPYSVTKPLERNLVKKTLRALQLYFIFYPDWLRRESWTVGAKRTEIPYNYIEKLVNKHLQTLPFGRLFMISKNLALARSILKITSDLCIYQKLPKNQRVLKHRTGLACCGQ